MSASSLVLAQTTVTLTGKRWKSGLGAQAVPVRVERGTCAEVDVDAQLEDESAETSGGARDKAGSGGGGGMQEVDGSTPDAGPGASMTLACDGDARRLDRAFGGAVDLVGMPERGCRQRSPTLLDCNLDARGEASFGLAGHLPQDIPTLGGFVPFCVTPLEIHGHEHRTEVHAVPRNGGARFTVAVVKREVGDEPSPRPDAGCDELFDCSEDRARVQMVAGVASGDIPSSEIGESDLLALNRDVRVQVELHALSAPVAGSEPGFLSEDAGCNRASGTSEDSLPLTIGGGRAKTTPFFVCADGYGGDYEVVASLLGVQAQDAGASAEDSSSDTFFVRPLMVTLDALPQGYVAKPSLNGEVVHTMTCGGTQKQTPPDEVQVLGADVVDDDERVEFVCTNEQSDQEMSASEDGGTNTAAACQDVTLRWRMGATCRLDVMTGE